MLGVVRFLIWLFLRLVLPLRYRVRVHGLDKLVGLKGPLLILPNHLSFFDPLIVGMALWPRFRPRPMVYEDHFSNPLIAPTMGIFHAVGVPSRDQVSEIARTRTEQALAEVIEGLKRGETHILWPTGHIQDRNVERSTAPAGSRRSCNKSPKRRSSWSARGDCGAVCSAAAGPARGRTCPGHAGRHRLVAGQLAAVHAAAPK